MADRLWRAQVSIPLDSGVPEDAIVNTWHFDDDDDPLVDEDSTGGAILGMLADFYHAIDGIVFPRTVGTDATVKMYDMADPLPRVPTFTGTFSLTPVDAAPLPNEVALCLSFAGDVASGDVPARRRGRIYLGPISETCSTIVGSQSRPNATALAAIVGAAAAMANGEPHTASPTLRLHWSIFSPTTLASGGTLGAAFNDVQRGWVDDAWDTQRRRGAEPTSRATFAG